MTDNTGFAAFALYNSLKLHFTSNSYNFFKYNGKTNVSKESFMIRKDRYSFYKLSRKFDLEELKYYLVSNFVYGDSKWIGEMIGPDAESIYSKWQKVTQSLTHNFDNDMIYLFDNYKPEELIIVKSGWPILLNEAMQGNIKLESLIIMNDIMNFFPMWNRKIEDDIVWPNTKLKCEKYAPFIQYDKVKFKNILKERVKEYAET